MSSSIPWWRERRATFLREIRAMQSLGTRWLTDTKLVRRQDGQLRWIGTIHFIRGYTFELIYPDDFPSGCPIVYPRDRSQRWSKHQWRSGELCTEYGQDTWSPQFTAAHIIRSLYDLLSTEHRPARGFRPRRPVMSRHDVAAGHRVITNALGVLLCPNMFGSATGTGGIMTLKEMSASRPRRWQLVSLTDQSGRSIAADIPSALAPSCQGCEGLWYRLSGVSKEDLFDVKFVVLKEIIAAQSKSARDMSADIRTIVERAPGALVPIALVGRDDQAFAAFVYSTNENHLVPIAVVPYDARLAAERRVAASHPGFAKLRVAVIGLGSLGSKIAVSLARIGIEDFILCDPDLFLWENLSRHELTAHDLGRLKVDGIADRIRACSPAAQVVEFNAALGQVRTPKTHREILDAVESSCLIVDASGDPRTARYIATLSYQREITSLHVEIYARGIGGQIIRVRPPHTGCYQCQCDALAAFLKDKPPAPDTEAVDYDVAADLAGQPVTADDDVCTFVAGAAARLAKDSLLRCSGGTGSVPGDVYLVGLQSEWIFDEPFQFIRIEPAPRNPRCSGCHGEEATRESLALSEEEVLHESEKAEKEIVDEQGDLALDPRK